MKKLFYCLFLPCLNLTLSAQTQGWLKHYPGNNDLHSIQVLPDGYAFLFDDSLEMFQTRVGLDGEPLNTLSLGTLSDDIIPSSDGGFFKGFLQNTNIRLQKLNTSGGLIWEKLLPDTIPLVNLHLAAIPDGGCYITCAKGSNAPPYKLISVVHRIAADGVALWMKYADEITGANSSASRKITDAVCLPDSSCILLTSDNWDGYHGSAHIFQIKPDGTAGFSVGHAYTSNFVNGAEFQLAQAAPDGSLRALGNKWTSSTPGGHTEFTNTGFSMRITQANGQVESMQADYPPTVFQTLSTYGPYPLAATPMPNGEMMVLVQQSQSSRLWRGSWDLKDTAWERPFQVSEHFNFWSIKRRNRVMYATPDGGAIIGGEDIDGIFLMKVGPLGNYSSSTSEKDNVAPLLIAPNPSKGMVTIHFSSDDVTMLLVSNLSGTVQRQCPVSPGASQYALTLEGLSPGIYIVRAFRENGDSFVGKILLE